MQPEETISDARGLILGTVINAVLTVCKFVIGTSTHCTALVADGFKDLANAARSGMRLGLIGLQKDVREHKERPRAALHTEKILSLVVFAAIVWMGVQSLYGTAKDVLDLHDTNYTPALLTITLISIVVKAFMAHHKRRLGRALHRESLVSEGRWAAVDSVMAGVILLTALLDRILHVDIDPWVGFGIGIVIVLYGIQTLLRRRKRTTADS